MSIWQTKHWQNMLKKSGQIEQFFELGNIFIEKRQVALGEFGLFVNGYQAELTSEIFEKLKQLCKEQGCMFVQVERLSYEGKLEEFTAPKGYYKKFIPPYTVLIDLELGEEAILANMKPKGRYNIRLAKKKGVVVEQVEKNLRNIEMFHELMRETTQRDGFAGNSMQYYQSFLESIEDSQLFFAYHEGSVIAAGIFVVSENVMTYYYGASTHAKKNLMAPYALQWAAIEHAMKRGLKYYDFLGVAGPDEKNSSLAGVTDFKMKLSKNRIEVSDSFIYIHKKMKYSFIKLLGRIKSYL